MQNPFTHTFGAVPSLYISTVQTEEIIENFSYENPSEKCYMITGVRGCGKTVMLSKITDTLTNKNWIVYDLNVTVDMVSQLAAKLAEHKLVQKKFLKANIDISAPGIKLGISYDKDKVFDIHVLLEKMISTLASHDKKIMITLDDVSATKEMREFAHTFQRFLRAKLPVYILMTGLLNNYQEVVNKKDFKDCTFLTRAFQVHVEPLNYSQVALSYLNVFNISEDEAIRLAKMTKGYAFAYQVLGWLYFEDTVNKKRKHLDFEYTSDLIKYCYSKLWSELTEKEIIIVKSLVALGADESKVKREDVIKYISKTEKISSSTFNTYRERLIGKGIISASQNYDGYYQIDLPQFGVFVRQYHSD